MNEALRHRVELGANIAIVLVSLLIGIILIKREVVNRTSISQNSAVVDPRRGPSPGQKVSLPNVDWVKNQRTLLLALSKGCRFCNESAEFYKKLASESTARSDLQLVAVLPQDVETGKSYLNEIGV